MKLSILFASAGLALAAWSTLCSAQEAGFPGDAAPGPVVQVSGRPSYKLAPDEFAVYGQFYRMTNGQIVRMQQRGRQYYAAVDDQPPVEIFGEAPGVFVTAKGATLTFHDDARQLVIADAQRLLAGGDAAPALRLSAR